MTEQVEAQDTVSPASELVQVLLITEEMLALAHKDSWDAIIELEQRRREILSKCFSRPIPQNHGHAFSEALAAMLHMNEEMIGLLEAAKKNVAVQRTDQRRIKRSLGHYLDVETGH